MVAYNERQSFSIVCSVMFLPGSFAYAMTQSDRPSLICGWRDMTACMPGLMPDGAVPLSGLYVLHACEIYAQRREVAFFGHQLPHAKLAHCLPPTRHFGGAGVLGANTSSTTFAALQGDCHRRRARPRRTTGAHCLKCMGTREASRPWCCMALGSSAARTTGPCASRRSKQVLCAGANWLLRMLGVVLASLGEQDD